MSLLSIRDNSWYQLSEGVNCLIKTGSIAPLKKAYDDLLVHNQGSEAKALLQLGHDFKLLQQGQTNFALSGPEVRYLGAIVALEVLAIGAITVIEVVLNDDKSKSITDCVQSSLQRHNVPQARGLGEHLSNWMGWNSPRNKAERYARQFCVEREEISRLQDSIQKNEKALEQAASQNTK